MSTRSFLQNLVSPSPLASDRAIRRTLMWPGQHGDHETNDALVKCVIDAADLARGLKLEKLDDRSERLIHQVWPGEHYRILAAFIKLLKPKRVVEFGTFQGRSSLSMLATLPEESEIHTFDLIHYEDISDTLLRAEDFKTNKLIQHLDNLAEENALEKHRRLLESTDFLFIDGPKDGTTEPRLIKNLDKIKFENPPIVVFDDIHNYKMLQLWDELPYPKFDMTSFGHWNGTGIVQWGAQEV